MTPCRHRRIPLYVRSTYLRGTWQARPLDALYSIVHLGCIHVKVSDSGAVRVKALYLTIGVNLEGLEEVLGCWCR